MAQIIVLAKKYHIQIHQADPNSSVVTEENEVLLLRETHPLYQSDPEAAATLNKMKLLQHEDIDKAIEYDASLSPEMRKRTDELSLKVGQARDD